MKHSTFPIVRLFTPLFILLLHSLLYANPPLQHGSNFLEVHEDFIHITLSVDPFVAPADVMRTLKSISTVHLMQQVPEIRSYYGRRGSFWKKGYLISTGDTLDPQMLRQFLDDLLS